MPQHTNVMKPSCLSLLIVFAGACLFAGCATSRPPTYQNPSFDTSRIDEIAVLSVIDARVDKKKNFKWDKMLPNPTKDKLKGKGYRARVVLDPSLVSSITQEAVEKADPKWIQSLGPPDARWVFVWSVTDVSHKVLDVESPPLALLGFWGPSGQAGMAAILFDKQNGTIAWRNEAHSRTPAAFGFLGMALAGLADNDAIEAAFQEITAGFPRKDSK
jgi:hypothetical protein